MEKIWQTKFSLKCWFYTHFDFRGWWVVCKAMAVSNQTQFQIGYRLPWGSSWVRVVTITQRTSVKCLQWTSCQVPGFEKHYLFCLLVLQVFQDILPMHDNYLISFYKSTLWKTNISEYTVEIMGGFDLIGYTKCSDSI